MNLKPETIRRMIDAVGREKFLAAFTKEEHLAALSKEDMWASLSPEEKVQVFIYKFGREEFFKMINQAIRK